MKHFPFFRQINFLILQKDNAKSTIILFQANGELYYFSTLIAFGLLTYVNPKLWVTAYDNLGPILGVLNISALVFCLYLLIKAKSKKGEKDPYLLANVNLLTIA